MAKRVSLKGKGADLFFGDYTPPSPPAAEALAEPDLTAAPADERIPSAPAAREDEDQEATAAAAPPRPGKRSDRSRAPRPPRIGTPNGAREQASAMASSLASTDASTVATIRKVVKAPGREVSFVRVTPEEKTRLADIVYAYKRRGQKTSENEINRIALNYLLLEYEAHGEQSVLARVLAALLA